MKEKQNYTYCSTDEKISLEPVFLIFSCTKSKRILEMKFSRQPNS